MYDTGSIQWIFSQHQDISSYSAEYALMFPSLYVLKIFCFQIFIMKNIKQKNLENKKQNWKEKNDVTLICLDVKICYEKKLQQQFVDLAHILWISWKVWYF